MSNQPNGAENNAAAAAGGSHLHPHHGAGVSMSEAATMHGVSSPGVTPVATPLPVHKVHTAHPASTSVVGSLLAANNLKLNIKSVSLSLDQSVRSGAETISKSEKSLFPDQVLAQPAHFKSHLKTIKIFVASNKNGWFLLLEHVDKFANSQILDLFRLQNLSTSASAC